MSKGGKREGAGRPKGKPNKVTKDTREVFQIFLSNNTDKLQMLFDKVAEDNPVKAIELLFKASEFVVPKLKSTEVSIDKEIDPVIRFEIIDTGVPFASTERDIVE